MRIWADLVDSGDGGEGAGDSGGVGVLAIRVVNEAGKGDQCWSKGSTYIASFNEL